MVCHSFKLSALLVLLPLATLASILPRQTEERQAETYDYIVVGGQSPCILCFQVCRSNADVNDPQVVRRVQSWPAG